MPRPKSALQQFVQGLKVDEKAAKTPASTLHKIIDDYCSSGEFDDYLSRHAADAQLYIPVHEKRKGRFRASAAGKCLQQQAYNAVMHDAHEMPDGVMRELIFSLLTPNAVKRPAQQYRALHNGTFTHVRYHLMFDALNEAGKVRTIAVEELRYNEELQMDGTIDRFIEFEFQKQIYRPILDFKSIKSKYWLELTDIQPDHVAQQHAYAKLNWNADGYMNLYEDKDTHQLKIYDAQYSDLELQRLKNNYRLMQTWVEQFEAGEENRIKLPIKTEWCNYCQWREVCDIEHPERLKQAQAQVESDGEDVF